MSVRWDKNKVCPRGTPLTTWIDFPGRGAGTGNPGRPRWLPRGEEAELGVQADQGGWSSGGRAPRGEGVEAGREGEKERDRMREGQGSTAAPLQSSADHSLALVSKCG